MMSVRVGTWNCGSTPEAKDILRIAMDAVTMNGLHVLCLQEFTFKDINVTTMKLRAARRGLLLEVGSDTSRLAVMSTQALGLEVFHDEGVNENRAQTVRVYVGSGPALKLANLHLQLDQRGREETLHVVGRDLALKGGEAIVLGDFNETPVERAVVQMLISGCWRISDTELECQQATRHDRRQN
jgi:endonuclease/exonuclease/phosphatase (EEP) superfamily protein YafD